MAFYSSDGKEKSKQDAEKKLEGRPDLKLTWDEKKRSFGVARRTLGKPQSYESDVFIRDVAKILDFVKSSSIIFITYEDQPILSIDLKKDKVIEYNTKLVDAAALLASENALNAFKAFSEQAKRSRVDDLLVQGAGGAGGAATKFPWDTEYEGLGSGDKIDIDHFDFSEMSGETPTMRP